MRIKNKALKLAELQALFGMEDAYPGIKVLQDENDKSIKKQIYTRFAKIYEYLHSVDKDHVCYKVHKPWRKNVVEDFKNIEKYEKGEL